MKYKYLLGGFTIASDLHFPELVQSLDDADVTISLGKVSEHLATNDVGFPFIEANEFQYLLRLPNIGRYLVENGTSVTIQPDDCALIGDVKNYVLTAIFGALSCQRNFLPMHGGAILVDGKAYLILGNSGVGKSTLLSSLNQMGYKVITDDISNIKIVNGQPVLYPSFPRIMIWKDTLAKMQIDNTTLVRVRSDMEKYFLQIDDTDFTTPVEIYKIFVLVNRKVEDALEVKGFNKINLLKNNIFHPWMINAFKKHISINEQIMVLSSKVTVERFYNNLSADMKFNVEEFIKRI
ncbi:hypothetical protein EZJ43_00920 [Pedobacter changchengzhani]|uniref:Serine kinase n=1 Tax=Pedobacter changchengzhani TaxID=2529274 RepID=A0A4R5MPA8_9SPHI|nr:hypothetical protein [Pedobacter changchengzhani]TDG37687.1 hypothetical protein EZJ43_00920 [Pedobacter changchengzhani]